MFEPDTESQEDKEDQTVEVCLQFDASTCVWSGLVPYVFYIENLGFKMCSL